MKFKELFEKYLNSKTSPEETEIVENEIEKNEIINEYLAEKIDLRITGERELLDDDNSASEDKEIIKNIQKSINRKLSIAALSAVLIVLLIFLSTKYIVSPLMDASYYNPSKKMGEFINKVTMDMAAFTELHFPGTITYNAEAEPLGFGSYNIKISQDDIFKGSRIVYEGKIEKGAKKYLQRDFYRFPYVNAFHYEIYGNEGDIDSNVQMEELNALPESSVAKVYVSFKKDITIEEVSSLMDKYNSLNFVWVAVRPSQEREPAPQFGFEPSGVGVVFERGIIDDTKYPYFELANDTSLPHRAEVLETHFKSLLKYMADNNSFLKIFEIPVDVETYTDTLQYIESNGVKSYGVLVMGRSSEILKLGKDPIVNGMMIDDIKLSSYSH